MNWMVKISNITLYHGSRSSFPVGFILTPQNDGYVYQERLTTDIVEKYRPPEKISRYDAVYMVDDPSLVDSAGGYDDYIYLVEPIGQVDKSDLSWYSEVEMYLDATPEEQKEWSLNYWNGVSYKNPVNSMWEYRAKQAKIVDIL